MIFSVKHFRISNQIIILVSSFFVELRREYRLGVLLRGVVFDSRIKNRSSKHQHAFLVHNSRFMQCIREENETISKKPKYRVLKQIMRWSYCRCETFPNLESDNRSSTIFREFAARTSARGLSGVILGLFSLSKNDL